MENKNPTDRFYYMIRYTFYTSLELSTLRAVKISFTCLWVFVFFLSCGFGCSVLKMGVERCNWALCRPPNCLMMNKRFCQILVNRGGGRGTTQYLTYQCLRGRLDFTAVCEFPYPIGGLTCECNRLKCLTSVKSFFLQSFFVLSKIQFRPPLELLKSRQPTCTSSTSHDYILFRLNGNKVLSC